jgi:hypothetical protein
MYRNAGMDFLSVPLKSGFIIHNIKQNAATRKADKEV